MSFTISLKIPLTIRTLSQLHVILMSVDIDSINHCYLFLGVVEEFGTKFLLSHANKGKDPFKRKLHKLLLKVLDTEKVYVDMSAITSSYLNSVFS